MNDMMKGINSSISQIFPNSYTRVCWRIIYAKFRKKFPSVKLRRLYWKAFMETNPIEFIEYIFGINNDNEATYALLKNFRFQNGVGMFLIWRSKLIVTNNLFERFNC